MADKRDVTVEVRVPLSVDDRALERPGIVRGWDRARARRYAQAVVAEIEANAGQFDDCRVKAIALDGGIASNAGAGVATIVRALRRTCEIEEDAPVTMRASIANVSGATMPFFRRARVSRFDFEMLSLNPVDFTVLNRVDNLNDLPIICDHFLHSYANDSLGFVFAYGHAAPKGSDGMLNVRRTALAAARSHASHVRLVRCAGAMAVSDEEAARQFDEMCSVLVDAGFSTYENGLFARPGKEDRFELMRARGADSLGFGAGAVTRLEGVESVNTNDFERYCARSADFAAITESVHSVEARPA